PRRARRRIQRQGPDREAQYRRESADPAEVRHPGHSDADPVQERGGRGPEGGRGVQVAAGRFPGQQPVRGYLGHQGRGGGGRQGKQRGGGGGGGHGNRDGNRSIGRDDEMRDLEPFEVDDSEIISPEELTQSRASMSLTELKSKPIHELVKVAESVGLESLAR